MIKTKDLKVGYDGNALIENINIEANAGKIVTLIGPNGSGKSTILKTITRSLKAIDGKVLLLDKDMDELKDAQIAKSLSMVMTKRIHSELMSVWDVVATGRYPYTGKLGILDETDKSKVNEVICKLRLEDIKDKDFEKISDGQRQRVMLARALCQEPKVLVLDEPTSYLDIKYKLDILSCIKDIAKKDDIAVIMSLHELDLAKKISDTVVCVDGDKIVKIGAPKEIFTGSFIQNLFDIEMDEFNPITCTVNMKNKTVDKNSNEEATSKKGKAKVIMVQGTMSNAGKSLIVAGLCRIFKQDGYRVAPFKSQNMALNSFITKEGLEMGRAQVMQAEASGIEPMVCMNPILLKPTSDQGSQVIVNGEVLGNMRAKKYFEYKKELIPEIEKAFKKLEEYADIIVIEGAGSPAEINLKQNDIVNMGLAKLVDAPVLLVGDIDRGGVFAQLLGTLMLLEDDEFERVEGLIINKFRGDKTILDPGIDMLEERGGIKVVGLVPYVKLSIDDEDSLSERLDKKPLSIINIGVIKTPRISNFTDFSSFEQIQGVQVHYIDKPLELEKMDMCIIPGSKNTIGDLKWLRESGLEAEIKKFSKEKIVFGICGGYQMLGKEISDPEEVEEGGNIRGMELLDATTIMQPEKTRTQVKGKLPNIDGKLTDLSQMDYTGYEIHMGVTSGPDIKEVLSYNQNVYGTYVHGIFDNGEIVLTIVKLLAKEKGVCLDVNVKADFNSFKESQYDLLASEMRKNIDMDAIYKMLRESRI